MRRERRQRSLSVYVDSLVYGIDVTSDANLFLYVFVGLVWPRACMACPVGGSGGPSVGSGQGTERHGGKSGSF